MSKSATSEAQHHALLESRRVFHRVLSSWAIDLMALRASGLDKPGPRTGLWNSTHHTSPNQNRQAA